MFNGNLALTNPKTVGGIMTEELNSREEVAEQEEAQLPQDSDTTEDSEKEATQVDVQAEIAKVKAEYEKRLHDTQAMAHSAAQEKAEMKRQLDQIMSTMTSNKPSDSQFKADYKKIAEGLYDDPVNALKEFESLVEKRIEEKQAIKQQETMRLQQERINQDYEATYALNQLYPDYAKLEPAMIEEYKKMPPEQRKFYQGKSENNGIPDFAQRQALYLITKAKLSNGGKANVASVSGKPSVPKSVSVDNEVLSLAKEFGVDPKKIEKREAAKQGGRS